MQAAPRARLARRDVILPSIVVRAALKLDGGGTQLQTIFMFLKIPVYCSPAFAGLSAGRPRTVLAARRFPAAYRGVSGGLVVARGRPPNLKHVWSVARSCANSRLVTSHMRSNSSAANGRSRQREAASRGVDESRPKRSVQAATAGEKPTPLGRSEKRPRTTETLLARGSIVMFYSKSKDIDDLGLRRPDWRKVLSNFHPVDIEVEGRRYFSVEHAFHAAKVRCSSNPDAAAEFEVGGSVPRDPLAAKKAGGRAGFAKLGARLDVARWICERDGATMAALRARLACDSTFREILAAVYANELQLLHFERSGAKSYWGGNIRKADGVKVGRNRLGEMLMQLAEESATTMLHSRCDRAS